LGPEYPYYKDPLHEFKYGILSVTRVGGGNTGGGNAGGGRTGGGGIVSGGESRSGGSSSSGGGGTSLGVGSDFFKLVSHYQGPDYPDYKAGVFHWEGNDLVWTRKSGASTFVTRNPRMMTAVERFPGEARYGDGPRPMVVQPGGRTYYTATVLGTVMAGFSASQYFYENPVPPKPAVPKTAPAATQGGSSVQRIILPPPPGKPIPRPIVIKRG